MDKIKWRAGMWVRIKGWQAHWPQRTAKIIAVSDGGTAFLDRKILNESAWHVDDLAKPFTKTVK